MGVLGKQGNKTRRVPPAFASGMRGSEKPNPEGREPSERGQETVERPFDIGSGMGTSKGAKTAKEGSLAHDKGSEAAGYSELVSQHINGPDDQGHHHLNITTLAAALRDRSEGKPGDA
jgi:hypothetical protein